MIYKFIFTLGIKLRNPSLKKYYEFLKETEKWNKGKLNEYQLNKLKDFLIFVYMYSEYYKNVFDSINFNPYNIDSLSDLQKIPIITKNELLDKNELIHSNYSFKKRFFTETSGTTGQPIKFYKNEEWDSSNRAAMFRAYSWYNVKPWDKNGYFWGYNISKKKRWKVGLLDLIQNRFRVFSYEEKEIIKFSKKLNNAKYLHGYSSMIYEVAKIVNKLKISEKFNLKMIKGTSEKIYETYQSEVKKAFGQKIVSEYGATESGLIAFECPHGSMHINVENVIVEVMDDGEILVTNLLSKSFPIIRYKLGDSIRLKEDNYKCKCGMSHPIIEDVEGRIGKVIYGNINTYPSLTFYYVFKNLALEKSITLNYQAFQNKKGEITLKIEQTDNDYKLFLREELFKYFKNDINFDILFNQQLHTMEGKLKDFITSLD